MPWHVRLITWVILAFAVWGFICAAGSIISLAHAGTCRIYGEGDDTVEACDDGSFSVTDRHGHKQQ